MPGPPYEYISGLILRYMEDPGVCRAQGEEGGEEEEKEEEERRREVKSRDP